MNSCALTDKGIVRHQNQDAFYVSCDKETSTAVLIVCDGMGGAKAGNVASDLACKVFSEAVKGSVKPGGREKDVEQALVAALKQANTAVFELSVRDDDCKGMGTTLVAAVVLGEKVFVLNVGDSRAYHITADGITQVTRDHSVVEDMIERGNITREESRTHPNKNLITRAVGTSPEVACDIFEFDVKAGEHLLLCSDGLTNMVGDDEILEKTRENDDLESCCEALMRLSVVRGAPDNITLVLFRA